MTSASVSVTHYAHQISARLVMIFQNSKEAQAAHLQDLKTELATVPDLGAADGDCQGFEGQEAQGPQVPVAQAGRGCELGRVVSQPRRQRPHIPSTAKRLRA